MSKPCKCLVSAIAGLSLGLAMILPAQGANGTKRLNEVVVTPTRSPKQEFDIPTPVSTLDSKRLQEIAPASAADALQEIPGVSMHRAGSWEASPVVRGLGSNRVLVLFDGDRETNLWAGRAPLTPFIDVGSIKRIEVVKGPASALYGTDALGGVINIITKDAAFADKKEWQFDSTVNSRYSSNENGMYGRYEIAAGGKGLGFRMGISGRDYESFEDGNGEEVNNSQFENIAFDLDSLYKFSDKQEISASARVNEIQDMGVPQKNPKSPFSHYDQFDTYSYKLGYNGEDIGLLDKIKFKSYYVDQKRSFRGHFPSSKKPVYKLKKNHIDTSSLGSSLELTITPSVNQEIIGGIELVREATDSHEQQAIHRYADKSIAKQLIFQPVPDASRSHIGVFVQDDIALGNRFTLIAGGRYDYYTADADNVTFGVEEYSESGKLLSSRSKVNRFSDKTDASGTFNLGLLYALTENIHLTSNLSTGFRAPDIFERYSTRGGGSRVILGNPSLNSEYSYNADLGLKTRFDILQGNINLYYNRVDNYIDTLRQSESFIADIPTYKYVNVQEAELYGFDASADLYLLQGLKLFGNMAYVVGEDRNTGENLNNIPPLHGTLGMHWERDIGANSSYWLEISADLFNKQDQPAPEESETPGYAIANLRTGLNFANYGIFHDVRLSLKVENLFDKHYYSHLRKNNRDYIPEPGLNVVSSVQFSF